jgi:sigma-E factor negative regulatory protein RseC
VIEELAIVENVGDGEVTIRTQRQSACGSCSANKGCGTKLLNQIAEDGQRWLASIPQNKLKLSIGDTVVVGLDESALTQGSALVYGVPLVLMIALAAIASWAGQGDAISALAAFLGLFSGFFYVRLRSGRVASQHHFKPVILRRVIPITSN